MDMDPAMLNYMAQMQQYNQAGYGNGGNTAQSNLFLQLLQQAQQQQNAAFNANQSRYNDSFQALVGDRNANLADVSSVGQSMLDSARNNYRSTQASLAGRGLSGSTMAYNNTGAYTDNLNQINDSLLKNRIATRLSTMAPITNLLGSRNDNYPDLGAVNGMLGQFGAQGGRFGVGGGTLPGLGGQFSTPGGGGSYSIASNTPVSVGPTTNPTVYPGPMPPQGQRGMTAGGVYGQSPPMLPTGVQVPSSAALGYAYRSAQPTLTAAQQTANTMQGQGYENIGNGNYRQQGSGIGGDGLIPTRVVAGPPPDGTRLVPGAPIFAGDPNNQPGRVDPGLQQAFMQYLRSRGQQGQGGGYGPSPAPVVQNAPAQQNNYALPNGLTPAEHNPMFGPAPQMFNRATPATYGGQMGQFAAGMANPFTHMYGW